MLTTCRAIPHVVGARRATACQPSRRIKASAALMRSATAIQVRVSLGSHVLLHDLCSPAGPASYLPDLCSVLQPERGKGLLERRNYRSFKVVTWASISPTGQVRADIRAWTPTREGAPRPPPGPGHVLLA